MKSNGLEYRRQQRTWSGRCWWLTASSVSRLIRCYNTRGSSTRRHRNTWMVPCLGCGSSTQSDALRRQLWLWCGVSSRSRTTNALNNADTGVQLGLRRKLLNLIDQSVANVFNLTVGFMLLFVYGDNTEEFAGNCRSCPVFERPFIATHLKTV